VLETTPPEYVGAFFDFYVNGSTVRRRSAMSPATPPTTLKTWACNHAAEFTAA
jgi:hypothetical protein